jgi:sec-independent protein translocase protein TatA
MGPSIWQLLIVLVIVLLLFGTKRMRNLGSDLGAAIRGFRNAMSDGEKDDKQSQERLEAKSGATIDVEVTAKDKDDVEVTPKGKEKV